MHNTRFYSLTKLMSTSDPIVTKPQHPIVPPNNIQFDHGKCFSACNVNNSILKTGNFLVECYWGIGMINVEPKKYPIYCVFVKFRVTLQLILVVIGGSMLITIHFCASKVEKKEKKNVSKIFQESQTYYEPFVCSEGIYNNKFLLAPSPRLIHVSQSSMGHGFLNDHMFITYFRGCLPRKVGSPRVRGTEVQNIQIVGKYS
ncbi:hypothetical protein HELRODRAFT_182800 [Helobdella robusta]|uniref:Uncharacterized protein n=1 Tax=Helobdella robusta TaxID=6412 RepID=T1FIR8_HELRO|nr:hypothetical protein HELRODRAFT_182800 [Helobdella robusta]ESN90106.1 hypothetical protein HELRODRAFT_182800 [Helobdella robusta]